jgi:hypothetical protein
MTSPDICVHIYCHDKEEFRPSRLNRGSSSFAYHNAISRKLFVKSDGMGGRFYVDSGKHDAFRFTIEEARNYIAKSIDPLIWKMDPKINIQ